MSDITWQDAIAALNDKVNAMNRRIGTLEAENRELSTLVDSQFAIIKLHTASLDLMNDSIGTLQTNTRYLMMRSK